MLAPLPSLVSTVEITRLTVKLNLRKEEKYAKK